MAKRIGSYEIIRSVAQGGMAEVFLARATSKYGRGKLVALKQTLPEYLESPEVIKMFLDEMRIAASLNHKNIVQTFDFGTTESQAYLVMEFLHGVSLRELLALHRDWGRPVDLSIALYVIKEVAEGLNYATHALDPSSGEPLNLVHRDLSPHNLMLTFHGEVKIIDFGIAKGVKQQTILGSVKGKFAYMSPEQISGHSVDQRSDLFSLGIILWEMLNNRRLFAGKSVDEIKDLVRGYRIGNLDFSGMIGHDSCRHILERLLHHNCERRYDSARELIEDINFVLNSRYPDFSSHELSRYLKNDCFSQKYLNTLEDFRLFGAIVFPNDIDYNLESTIVTFKGEAPLLKPPIPAMSTAMQMRVVSTNDESGHPALKYAVAGVAVSFFLAGAIHFGKSPKVEEIQMLSQEKAPDVSVLFVTNPIGVTMLVDGQKYLVNGPLPLYLTVNKVHRIEVFKEGFVRRSFDLLPQRSAQFQIALEPAEAAPTSRSPERTLAATRKPKKYVKSDPVLKKKVPKKRSR